MPTRSAEAEWKGNLLEGSGTIKLGSGAFEGSYDWRGRSADGAGTNPRRTHRRGPCRMFFNGSVGATD